MRTVRSVVVVLLCMLAWPVPGEAQTAAAKWAGPKCELKPGHFLVNGGQLHLKSATETRFDDQRTKELQDAQRVLVQAVTHPSRVHLDIETDDIEAETKRLEALGARRIGAVRTWVVMEAPTGQRFCVVRPQRANFKDTANSWD